MVTPLPGARPPTRMASGCGGSRDSSGEREKKTKEIQSLTRLSLGDYDRPAAPGTVWFRKHQPVSRRWIEGIDRLTVNHRQDGLTYAAATDPGRYPREGQQFHRKANHRSP